MTPGMLKQRLNQGEVLYGLFVNCADPTFVEIAGYGGFDFAVIDLEHGPLHSLAAQDLCRAAQVVGLAPIVRVRKNDLPQIQRALDIGSAGVQVPQIETQAEAEAVVQAAKYYPIGKRGLSFYTRAGFYGAKGTDLTGQMNDNTLVVVHVEGVLGVENLAAICQVSQIDVVFLGPYDLSQSLGIPGQVNDPRVVELMERSIHTIRQAGKAVGTFSDRPEVAQRWIKAGVQYLALGVDGSIFLRGCQSVLNSVKSSDS